MYQRIKQSIYPEHHEEDERLEDVKVDSPDNDNDNVPNNSDGDTNTYQKNTLSSKISNVFSYITKGLASHIASGVSNSWFITCCVAIYTKHYFIYKLSKKTPADYNNMVKNIASKMADKNIFFTKIFQAFANNNNLVDKDLFHHFITYTDNFKYNTN